MKFNLKVIVRPTTCGTYFGFFEYLCQRQKVTMDAPVSFQGKTDN